MISWRSQYESTGKNAGFISVSTFPLALREKFTWTFSFHRVMIVEYVCYSAVLAWKLDKKLVAENTSEAENETWKSTSVDRSEARWMHATLSLITSISKHPVRGVSAYSFYSCLSLASCRKRYDFLLPLYHLWPKITWSSFVMPLCTWILKKEVIWLLSNFLSKLCRAGRGRLI